MDDIPYGYCHCGCGNKTTISKHTNNKHGRRKGEPTLYLAGHGKQPRKGMKKHKRTWEEFFWERIDKSDPSGCWNWTGALTMKGYGMIHIKGKQVVVHRYTYELRYGTIPDDMYALHKCDNRRCVNPDHIFLGTKADNARDMVAKRRSMTGERNHKAKLTEEQVSTIKEMYNTGLYSQGYLGKKFGIHQGHVSKIVLNKEWKHI